MSDLLRPEVEPPRPQVGTIERLVLLLAIVVLATAESFAIVRRALRDDELHQPQPALTGSRMGCAPATWK